MSKKTKNKPKKVVKRFILQTVTWIVVFTFVLSSVIPLSFALIFRSRIFPNIFIGSHNLSGKTKTEATDYLTNTYKNLSSYQFHLTFDQKSWVFTGNDWGIKLNAKETVDNAYQIGRDPSIFTNIVTLLKSSQEPVRVPLLITLDESLFAKTIETIAEEIDRPLILPAIIVEKDKVTVSSGMAGKKLDSKMLKDKITSIVSQNNSYTISLPVITLSPPVGKNQEEQTQKRAETLLSKKLTIVIGESYYDLSDQELISLLSFTGDFETEKIASVTANLARAYDRLPQNAAFNFENGRVTVFKPGKNGQKIQQEKAVPLLQTNLTDLEATVSNKLTLTLPITTTSPEITTEKVNDLGIRELIGKGISYFRGSITSRIHNISLASSKLNGLLIKPGETFSFNDAVGDISGATGFQQAYIIQNGRTILGDGGGVCQVSTTLFRAALAAGLPIVERQAHAYRVAYYEQGFGPGIDATVFAPSVDLKFKNDTPTHILIQTQVNTANLMLTFELYGSSDGRIASLSTPRVWEQSAPPPPKYEDDPTLPVGQEKQVDWAAWGAKASFDYKVVRNGEVLINKTFYSNFRPWQAVYLRGTKQ